MSEIITLPAGVRVSLTFFLTCEDFDVTLEVGNLPVIPNEINQMNDPIKVLMQIAPELLDPFKKRMADLRPMTSAEITEYKKQEAEGNVTDFEACPCGDNDGNWCSLPACPYERKIYQDSPEVAA